jgi:TonB family protein
MDTSAIRSDWVGRTVDYRFPLLKWLGGSELGGVFLTELGGPGSQKAAIKLIPADGEDVESRLAGWAAASTLSHPHLMRLLHNGQCRIEGIPLLFVVTEFAEEVLSQIIPDRPLSPAEVEQMLNPALDVLSYLHARGFVHSHLKPSNIMVVGDRLKLSVDGLRIAGAQASPPSTRSVYDAPENADGTISPASDLWALGVTIVEALTQHPPDLDTNGDPVVPETIPQPFAAIARECLRSHPVRRSTLRDVKARLKPAPSIPEPVAKAGVAQILLPKILKAAPAKFPVKAFIVTVLVLFALAAALLLRSHRAHSVATSDEQQDAPPIAATTPETPVPAAPVHKRSQGDRSSAAEGAVAQRVVPEVPQFARNTIHGRFHVGIRVAVDPKGNVSSAGLDSPGPSKYFANLALEAARKWKFKPPYSEGRAVSSVWMLRFQFTRAATDVTPVEVSP